MKMNRLSGAAIAVVAVAGMSGGLAAPVFAAPAPAAAVTVDANQPAQVSIHKYLGAPTGQPNDGSVQNVALPPLAGVVFDIYQIAVDGQVADLSTNAGLATYAPIAGYQPTAADVAAGTATYNGHTITFTKVGSATTDNTGAAVYAGAKTAYVGVENLAASTTITNGTTGAAVQTASVTPVAPFMFTLPMTTADGTGWMYDVNVYPKNASDTVTKTVTDQGTVGTAADNGAVAVHQLTYGITGSVTPGMTAAQIGTYVLADKFDSHLTFTGVTVKAGDTAMVAGTDYTVWINGAQWDGTSAAPAGATVQVVLTQAGIQKAVDGGSVVANMTATVDGAGVADATVIPNTATLMPNQAWWASRTGGEPYNPAEDTPGSNGGTPVTPNTSNEVESHYGPVNITKTATDTGAALAGATFDVYSDANDTTGTCDAADITDANLIVGGITTDANGAATVGGLQDSAFYNGIPQTNLRGYCLVEIAAPAGYSRLPQPVAFIVSQTATGNTIAFGDALKVADTPNVVMPLTGGQGPIYLAAALGSAAVAGGVGVHFRNRKKAASHNVAA